MKGGDVIMAAETGSGKTQAYLSPIFSKLLEKHGVETPDMSESGTNEAYLAKAQDFALILCPNSMLCEQVAAMGKALCDSKGGTLLKISVVSGGQVGIFLCMNFQLILRKRVLIRGQMENITANLYSPNIIHIIHQCHIPSTLNDMHAASHSPENL
jgi:hypothetical protein